MDSPQIKFDLLKVGHCLHPECIVMRGRSWTAIEFPTLAVLLEHPVHGLMLYDTGYSRHFMEATSRFPECLYRMVTPPSLPPEEELLSQLAARNIAAEQIGTILISHFHADHIAGLRDFPKARFIATRAELGDVRKRSRFGRLRKAFLSGLLPADFDQRVNYAEERSTMRTGLAAFPDAHDLLEDASLAGISLPGHTRSQLGIHFTDHLNRRVLLSGDAAWKIEALAGRIQPSPVTRLLFADYRRYCETFHRLADLHAADPDLHIIPSHCSTSLERYGRTTHISRL